MGRYVMLVSGLLATLLGVFLLLDSVAGVAMGQVIIPAPPLCNDHRASDSLAACADPGVQCAGQSEGRCTDSQVSYYEVKQDFPTACIYSPGNSCVTTEENCYRPTRCHWDMVEGKCIIDPSMDNPWIKAQKRKTISC